ncbi:MAG: class I SAM-dependent methyltransferase [Phototrophicaceae bacterium]
MESKFSPAINVYQDMYDFEDGHWWYQSLRKMLLHWVKQIHPKLILDAGTGTGANMYMLLHNGYPTVGVDISDHAIQFCQQRGLHQISKASITHLPYESQTFDLVISMDVLPFVNVSDLPTVLAEFHRCLKPNGYVVVNLAALAWLQSEHDVAWDTKKRYRKDEIEHLFKDAGFQIVKSTYRIFLLFPLVAGMKWLTNLQRLSDHTTETRGDTNKTNPLLNRIFSYVMDVEFLLNRFVDFPIGSSVFLVVQKRP